MTDAEFDAEKVKNKYSTNLGTAKIGQLIYLSHLIKSLSIEDVIDITFDINEFIECLWGYLAFMAAEDNENANHLKNRLIMQFAQLMNTEFGERQ